MTNQTEPSRTHQSIGQLARSVGVGIDAIRFYERIGLLPAAKRSAAGYRLFALESLVAACPGHGDPSHCPILAALLAGEGEVPRPERPASKLTSPRKRTRSSRG